MERARRPQPAPRSTRAPKPEARARAASLAVVATAAIAIAACLSVAPLPSTGGAIAPTEVVQGGDAAAYQGLTWPDVVLAPAYAQGDAYVITDLGNTFKLDIEQPPGINWTQVLLDRIAESEDRSRRSVDALRDDTRGVTDDIRRAIDDYIRNNTALLNDRERRFAEYTSTTNMTIASMISNDVALNASINQLARDIYMDLDNEAAISGMSSQMRYVQYDNPARIMKCIGNVCGTDHIDAVMHLSSGTTAYHIYDDPSWPSPNEYTISSQHYGAMYTNPNTMTMQSIPGNYIRLYDSYLSFGGGTAFIPGRNLAGFFQMGTLDRYLGTKIMVWGCFTHAGVCNYDNRVLMPPPTASTRTIDTPVGYPYHVNMISKETAPPVPIGINLTAYPPNLVPSDYSGPRRPDINNPGGYQASYDRDWTDLLFGYPSRYQQQYGGMQTPFQHHSHDGRTYGPSNNRQHPSYDAWHTQFDRTTLPGSPGDGWGTLNPAATHALKYDTSELVGAGIGARGELLKYFRTGAATIAMPVSGTSQTWPNCASLPRCDDLSFAFGEHVPKGSEKNRPLGGYNARNVPDSWTVFISPQLRINTWDSHNTMQGTYSASPQFIDRMNKRILAPAFPTTPPSSEAGKLYDVRGYVRIPFAPETPMNVSHVSLRPSSELLDTAKIGRDYMRATANTPSNIYNLDAGEIRRLGLANCELKSGQVECEKREAVASDAACRGANAFAGLTGANSNRCRQQGSAADYAWTQCRLTVSGGTCTTLSEIGKVLVSRADFSPENNVGLSQLEGVYSGALYVPVVQGYSGFRLVIDGVGIFTYYKDVRADDSIFLSPPKSAGVDRIDASPIHAAAANVSTTAQVVASRDGTMNILAVVSATGSVDISNEYLTAIIPPPPPPRDPLSVTMKITKNGAHHETKGIGVNAQPATTINNTSVRVPQADGSTEVWAIRGVEYEYPSFVFAGTASVPVSAGDHVLFELTAHIDGEIDEWNPAPAALRTRGISSADIVINAASVMMGVK